MKPYISKWNIPSRKCLIVIYTSPPSQNKSFLLENMSKSLSRYLKSYKNITLLGNFNVNPKDENLQHFTYTFSLSHLINKPTCFKGSPSCIHLIITDRKSTSKYTAQKMKFSIKDFFSKCDQILSEKLHFFMQWYLSNSNWNILR